ncbi:MAG: PAS domain-containing protein [Pseudomonadota bacterium]
MADDLDAYSNCFDLLRARFDGNAAMIGTEIRALHRYWERLRNGRDVPYRAEVDPRDMTCDVRYLFVLEDLGEGNLRFRLAGTALNEAFGVDLRGMSARTLMQGRARESFTALIQETLAEPGVGYARLDAPDDDDELWEVVLLPLRSDLGAVDRVLGGLVPVRRGRQARGTGRLRLTIAKMSILGLEESAPRGRPGLPVPLGQPPLPVAGFAEEQAAFEGPKAPGPLRAIEGGLGTDARPAGQARERRDHLRLVRDD